MYAAHESHVAGDNAIDALVIGTTPLLHAQASSLNSAYCELSRAAMYAAYESHVAGDDAIDARVTGTTTPLFLQVSSSPQVSGGKLNGTAWDLDRSWVQVLGTSADQDSELLSHSCGWGRKRNVRDAPNQAVHLIASAKNTL